jgi:hypothetical protein
MKGNMWSSLYTTNYFVVTANSTIKSNGALVMGRGIAKEVRDLYPGIDLEIGNKISSLLHPKRYLTLDGFKLFPKLMLFQVKYHFAEHADIELIDSSAFALRHILSSLPDKLFNMNFPGIGNGNLKMEDVLPILENHFSNCDNIVIWEKK